MDKYKVQVSCFELEAPDLPACLKPVESCAVMADGYGSAALGVVAHVMRSLKVDFHAFELVETSVGLFCMDGSGSESVYRLSWRADACHPSARPYNCPDLRISVRR